MLQAGLVIKSKQQYYTIFTPAVDLLARSCAELIDFNDVEVEKRATRVDGFRIRVVNTFFHNGRLLKLPAQYKKRRIVLAEFVPMFQSGVEYEERQVNEIISTRAEDYCTIRRLLVEEGFMSRAAGVYRLGEPVFRQEEQLLPEFD